jgi:long-subunit acyl-CoA synthetase (AMP-forming)
MPYRDNYTKILPGGFISFGGPTPEGATDYEDLFVDPPELDLDNLPPAEEAGNSMIYTSGTTGQPKGAARSTDFITKEGVMDYLFQSIGFFKLADDEIHLVCCPL